MSCSNITQGISKGCNNNLGGIRTIYISEQPIQGYVLSGNIITSFSPSPTWLTIEADQGTGNFLETYEINQMGGIVAFKQSVTFQINDLSAYNQQRIAELAESTNLGVVVEMNNGKLFTVGIERGAYLETGSTSSGTAYGDLSGSTITITGMEEISSLEVNETALNTRVFVWYQSMYGGNTYTFANNVTGPTLTSEESAAMAIGSYDNRCVNGQSTSWQSTDTYVPIGVEPANASPSNPIPLYQGRFQTSYSIFQRYNFFNYWKDLTVIDPDFCNKYNTNIYQMEVGDIGGKAYLVNATLIYTI